ASVGVVALMNWKSVTLGCGLGYAVLVFDVLPRPATTATPAAATASTAAKSSFRFMNCSPLSFPRSSPAASGGGTRIVARPQKAVNQESSRDRALRYR